MAPMPVHVRAARPDDAAPELLYLSAQPYYDAYAGDGELARALLARVYPREAHSASYEVCHVAELDGEVVGVLAGFPAETGDRLARRFVRLTVPRLPLRRWPGVLRHLRAAGLVAPRPPLGSWYVDALAVGATARRRGVARALLAEAERLAAGSGARGVALDTGLANASARALYEGYGFVARDERRAPNEGVARTVGGPGFVSYFKAL